MIIEYVLLVTSYIVTQDKPAAVGVSPTWQEGLHSTYTQWIRQLAGHLFTKTTLKSHNPVPEFLQIHIDTYTLTLEIAVCQALNIQVKTLG